MSKDKVNEGLFGAAKKFSDAFFDGLKRNQADSVLKQARKARMDREVIQRMEKLKRDKEELDKILSKIPMAKK
jgi:hypothetical protein